MNKKGGVFLGIGLGIVIWIFFVLFIPFLQDDVTNFRTISNCTQAANLTGSEMANCLLSDAMIPYAIYLGVALAIGLVIGGFK